MHGITQNFVLTEGHKDIFFSRKDAKVAELCAASEESHSKEHLLLSRFNSAVAQPLRRTFSFKEKGRVGQDIYKRRLLRFGFDG